MKTIYLAGGCFWGVQKYFDQFDGVVSTEVGYANGPEEAPSYQDVCITSVRFVRCIAMFLLLWKPWNR